MIINSNRVTNIMFLTLCDINPSWFLYLHHARVVGRGLVFSSSQFVCLSPGLSLLCYQTCGHDKFKNE